jgi:hypothetical protein
MKKLFTERFGLTQPRVKEELDAEVATGLLSIIKARIDEDWFGEAFPNECQDGGHNIGCDTSKLKGALAAYNVIWPWDWPDKEGQVPAEPQLFDLVEFSYEHIAQPKVYGFHSFFSHDHLGYDQEAGRARFTDDINRVFARHGIAFELVDGEVTRMAPTGLQVALAQTVFQTGDQALDELLEDARHKFLNRDLKVRRESLEKLWDAWERLKTIEPGKDKKAQATALLAKVSKEPNFLARLEKEAQELTEIGNKFMIRHTETDKIPINESAHIDYLFQRMFAIIRLFLRASGRGG